jgi:hypothetical protein
VRGLSGHIQCVPGVVHPRVDWKTPAGMRSP